MNKVSYKTMIKHKQLGEFISGEEDEEETE